MTFLEAIKKAKPGQIIKNEILLCPFRFVILINNTIEAIDCVDSIDTSDMNDTNWEIELEMHK